MQESRRFVLSKERIYHHFKITSYNFIEYKWLEKDNHRVIMSTNFFFEIVTKKNNKNDYISLVQLKWY